MNTTIKKIEEAINRMGFDSLTPREKEMLEEASRNLNAQKKRLKSDSDEELINVITVVKHPQIGNYVVGNEKNQCSELRSASQRGSLELFSSWRSVPD